MQIITKEIKDKQVAFAVDSSFKVRWEKALAELEKHVPEASHTEMGRKCLEDLCVFFEKLVKDRKSKTLDFSVLDR